MKLSLIAEKYEQFSMADPVFYDVPERIADEANRFDVSERPAPDGWVRKASGLWVSLRPSHDVLPAQGWKIHVSATVPDAERVLGIVWEHCLEHQLAFKFLRSRSSVRMANGKYANRGESGKFITLYPLDEARFAATLESLAPKLEGFEGPYILNDLRYGRGPLFVRYGAFAEQWGIGDDGERFPAIRRPDGTLVPDRREPRFSVPDFVSLPDILKPHLNPSAEGASDFPYRVEYPIHFSNGGGVYVARHLESGERVVLREARPHAGLDGYGLDAVARLLRERDVLARLAGLDCVPRLIGHFIAWEHHFLVEEFVEGETLLNKLLTHHPLVHPAPSQEELTAYATSAADILDKVEAALAEVHARGIRFGDLHPGNVMLRPDGRVALVDFEISSDLSDNSLAALGVPGFIAPAGMTGAESDRFALDRLRLMVLVPITQLLGMDTRKASTLADVACQNLPVPPRMRSRLPRGSHEAGPCAPDGDPAGAMFLADRPHWPAIRESLIAGIHASATPGRDDRLFPGDPAQFPFGGAALVHGAAGVLLALTANGASIPDAYGDWLERAATRPGSCAGSGLYDGPHGVALALERLGRREAALKVLERAGRGDGVRAVGLFGGRAGIALNLLHFARLTGDGGLHAAALRLAEELARTLTEPEGPLAKTKPGLLRGMSGPALLFLHLYEGTGEARYLDLAEQALRWDLAHCVMQPDGTFQVRTGVRHLVYLDGGTGGIALVLAEYLRRRDAPDLAAFVEPIRRGLSTRFVMFPGLFEGRAGLLAALNRLAVTPEDRAIVMAHVQRLGWHALLHEGHLAFPGTRLRRLSMDLATGSAGVLLALKSAFEGTGDVLPFLDPLSSRLHPGRR